MVHFEMHHFFSRKVIFRVRLIWRWLRLQPELLRGGSRFLQERQRLQLLFRLGLLRCLLVHLDVFRFQEQGRLNLLQSVRRKYKLCAWHSATYCGICQCFYKHKNKSRTGTAYSCYAIHKAFWDLFNFTG